MKKSAGTKLAIWKVGPTPIFFASSKNKNLNTELSQIEVTSKSKLLVNFRLFSDIKPITDIGPAGISTAVPVKVFDRLFIAELYKVDCWAIFALTVGKKLLYRLIRAFAQTEEHNHGLCSYLCPWLCSSVSAKAPVKQCSNFFPTVCGFSFFYLIRRQYPPSRPHSHSFYSYYHVLCSITCTCTCIYNPHSYKFSKIHI